MKLIQILAVTATISVTAVIATSGTAKAQSYNELIPNIDEVTVQDILSLSSLNSATTNNTPPEELATVEPVSTVVETPPPPPQPIEHTIASGENLTTIAKIYGTTWQRIFNKNPELANQDVLAIGYKLRIPTSDETLAERPISYQPAKENASQTSYVAQTPKVPHAKSTSNTYARGYCTWHAKNRRPDLPNNLGNANTWYARATNKGSTPRVGAIATTTRGSLGHVAYVESVNKDGTITISEMNYKGRGVISTRTTSSNEFRYIY